MVSSRSRSAPVRGVTYSTATRRQTIAPSDISVAMGGASASGVGYRGADGGLGSDVLPASMGPMTLLPPATRAMYPYRMNVKLLMRFGTDYVVCSGSTRDAKRRPPVISTTLSHGTTVTTAFLLLSGSTVVSQDVITAQVP